MINNNKQLFIEAFSQIGINLTPAGIWQLDEYNKKQPVTKYSTHRKNHIKWDDYQDDNMAKHYLSQDNEILIVDVDGQHIVITDNSIDIPELNLTLPMTFYTETSQPGKYHFYYSLTNPQDYPSRVVAVNDTKVDVFTYGNVFEWHSFSDNNKLHNHPVVPAPKQLLDLLLSLDLPLGQSGDVTPTTNIQRYNVVTKFLQDELESNKQWFAFFKSIFPAEYLPKNRRKLSIEDFPLNYDLVNKIAVKLTSTSELDHYEHTIPTLYKLLELWEIDPLSNKSQQLIHRNILASLPNHEAINTYSIESDVLQFQEHLDAQTGTTSPVFKVIDRTVKYIEIDKLTQQPIEHNGTFLMDEKGAQTLHPERNIVTEEGKVIGWDGNVPLLYYMNDPYEPQYILDQKHQRHTINLYTPSRYMQDAEAVKRVPIDNIVFKTLHSGIGTKWLKYVLHYHAYIIFGRESLNMVLWMASLPTDLGGAGKSIATVEVLSMIAGGSVQSINEKTAMSGWGDVVASSRMISLEDMTDLGKKEWDQIYAMIKQQTSNAFRKLNMKGSAIDTRRVSVSISGSSNHRPMLPPSDRRFLCLEPSHLRGNTEPLTEKESTEIGRILRSRDHEPELQEYVNYLKYLYSQPLDTDMRKALFERTPQTEYRAKWVGDGATNTQNIIHSISDVSELMGIVKIEDSMGEEIILHLLQMVMAAYNPDTNKTAVSYKWFGELLPFVVSERFRADVFSKHAIAKMLQIDFKKIGTLYSDTWKNNPALTIPNEWKTWPTEGYMFNMTKEQYKEYHACVLDMMPAPIEPIRDID